VVSEGSAGLGGPAGDLGAWNGSGEQGKCLSGPERCVGPERRPPRRRPNFNRHREHSLAFAVRATRIRSGDPCRPGRWL